MKAKDLKNSILQMAVQGKLVPQDSSDESASVLLERIRKERARLIKEKKIKAPKGGESIIYRASDKKHYEKRIDAKGRESDPVCIDDEIPFEIPKSWEWVRLGSLCLKIGSGSTPAGGRAVYTTSGPILIRSQNVYDEGLRLDDVAHFSHETYLKRGSHVKARDILLNITGASIGRCAIVPDPFEEADVNQHVLILRLIDYSPQEYLHLAMISPVVQGAIMEQQVGATKEGLSATKAGNLLIPLPPLREQKHICDRIEQILVHISQYDALETAREQLDAELPDRLRKSILQMAVQGKLVPQDPNDEPASVLLERIREQRRQLIAEGKIKAPKGGESVIYRGSDGGYYEKYGEKKPVPLKAPFDIPASWEWTRMSSLIQLLSGVDLEAKQYNENQNGIPYLTGASNFNQGCLVENRWTDSPKRISRRGDLLFTCKGTVGEMAVNPFEEAHIARQIMAISPHDQSLLNYLRIFLSAMVVEIKTKAKGVIPGIERNTLLDALVPLPPKVEQQRIVQRSEALLELCS